MNFTGQNNKICFQNSPLYKLVLDSLRNNACYKNCDQSSVDSVVMKWLRGSCDRNGGRERRRQKSTGNSSAPN
ncbi:unnamed protein product [Allacma fusca]|uniref:Uncharacterized protein n=1 Tax=Allacma fusca TaxID=39272 RepID=A0A8J2KXD3_9HEXA|nr:unnamed protein product [Allacma fusca]